MRIAKTDQTVRMPRLIRAFAGCTDNYVGFVMMRLEFIPFLFSTALFGPVFSFFMYIKKV